MNDIHSRLPIKRRPGDWMRARLPFALAEFVMFVLKQGWTSLAKAGSWYLLLHVSVVQVMLVHRDRGPEPSAPEPSAQGARDGDQVLPHHGPRQ